MASTSGGIADDQQVWLLEGGACTSVGLSLAAAAAAVRAGITGFAEHPYLVDSSSKAVVVARVEPLPLDAGPVDRLVHLAVSAADEALQRLGSAARALAPVPVFLGLPTPREGLTPDELADAHWRFERTLCRGWPIGRCESVACGHAAGLLALGRAAAVVRSGAAPLCLVGGVDSYLSAETLEALERRDQLHSAGPRNNAWGFIPGEGAGFCIVAREDALRSCGLSSAALLRSATAAHEPNPIHGAGICLGKGLTEAFERAFTRLAPEERVDDVYCDMNGEPFRADEYGFATLRTAERFVDATRFRAPADCWGDVGAATAPLLVNLAVRAYHEGHATHRRVLLWASSAGGERAAALIAFDVARASESMQ